MTSVNRVVRTTGPTVSNIGIALCFRIFLTKGVASWGSRSTMLFENARYLRFLSFSYNKGR